MTFRDTPWPDGTPCWIDLMVPDRKKALPFYRELFGWDLHEGGEDSGFYTMAMVDGRAAAGIGEFMAGQPEMPPVWTTYLAVSDVDKTVAAISEAGGQVLQPAMDVMTAGRLAVAADPTGAAFGLWQAGDHTGAQVANVPDTQVWNECMTRDFETAKDFYTTVFGYGLQDISAPGFTYAALTVDGHIVGGLGGLPAETPAEVPAHWAAYLSVRDTDAAVAKAVELGGNVLQAAVDTPYGRQAALADNQGAAFHVIAPNEQSGSPEDREA